MNLNGAQPLQEQFAITDSVTRMTIPVRELSDAQLTTYSQDLDRQVDIAKSAVVKALHELTQVVRGAGALAYEVDRRARSLVIATHVPLQS